MAFTKKNEEAVSPVIGVILMVAITVILAAVIAAFVFGMAGNVGKTKVIALTAQRPSSTTLVITNMGGPDVGTLSSTATTPALTVSGFTTSTGSTVGRLTGSSRVFTLTGDTTAKQHVIVTGTFADSTSQVLLDTYV